MQFLDALINGLLMGCAYAVVALGFVLVFKASMVLNLAYGAIIMVLAFLLVTFISTYGLPLWLSVVLSIVAGGVICFLLERSTIRPLIGQSFLAPLIMTIVIGVVLSNIAVMAWGRSGSQNLVFSFIPSEPMVKNWHGITIMWPSMWAFIAAAVTFILAMVFFQYTRLGLGMRAVAEHHLVAQSLGIRVKQIFSLTWVISGLLAALCAIIMGSIFSVTRGLSDYGLAKGLPVVLLGGLNSIPGALVGGLIVGATESIGNYLVVNYVGGTTSVQSIIPWILMLIILIIRPWGLFGERRIERI